MTIINAAGSNDREVFVQALISALSDFYTKEPGTNLEKLYSALAAALAAADRDISAVRNDNFVSATETDEIIVRGTNEDHIANEGVFQIDRVGLTPSYYVRQEQHYIDKVDTIVTLEHIPADFDSIIIYNAKDANRVQASIVRTIDAENNAITVSGVSNPGLYLFQFLDKGNVKSETETLILPAELFKIGFDEGGFGNFGFGE